MTIIIAEPSSAWTYTILQAKVLDWLHRSDLATQVEDFISLAEDELNTELRIRLMEVDTDLTVSAGDRTVALPARYIEPVKLELVYGDGSDNQELVYLPMSRFVRSAAIGSAVEPRYWTINEESIEFPDPVDRDYSLIFRILRLLDIASTETNALLTQYKGLYLYGALLQAAPYIRDDARIPMWQQQYDRLKAKVMKKEARNKALATLMTDAPGIRYRSNILRG